MRKYKFKVRIGATQNNTNIVGIEKFVGKEIIVESPNDTYTNAVCRLPKSNIINKLEHYSPYLNYIEEIT
jgi:hypothetical protein